MPKRVTAFVIAAVALCCASCGGGDAQDASAAPTQQGATPEPAQHLRQIPVQGSVDGVDAAALLPGVNASAAAGSGGVSVSVDRDSDLLRLGPDGAREQVGSAAAGSTVELPAGGSGEAVYYEAAAHSGGNKAGMGVVALPPGLLKQPIVFVRQNLSAHAGQGPFMAFRNLASIWDSDGQAIMRLDPDGTLTQILTISDRPMQDLEVSYDAAKIAFTMREFGGDDMELFEMHVDGTNLTQLTFNEFDDAEPTYLPDGRILFTSKRFGIGDFYDSGTEVPQLLVLDPFTGSERIVHIAADGCFNPIVAHNGQVYFVSWDTRININGPRFNRFTIWHMDPDGTDAFPVFGSHIARDNVDCFIDVRETHDHKLLAIHTNFDIPGIGRAHHENFGAGSVLLIDPTGNPDFPSYKYLTEREIVDSGPENTLGRYKFPVGLPNGDVLVTYAPGDVWDDHGDDAEPAPDFGLYILHDGERVKLCDSPDAWEYGAMPLVARPAPPVIPDATLAYGDGPDAFGEFACANIFDRNGDMRQGHPRPEDGPWKLRVAQALRTRGIPTGNPGHLEFDHGNFAPLAEGPVIGEYPIAPDGSFRIRIPANTPITWELVDGKGRVAVRERMFNIVRPGEQRSCAGCHARIDVKQNVDKSRSAFQPKGAGFHDLRGLFEDFQSTLIDNTVHEDE